MAYCASCETYHRTLGNCSCWCHGLEDNPQDLAADLVEAKCERDYFQRETEELRERIQELKNRLKWAGNMMRHYLRLRLLPEMSAHEVRKFLFGGSEDEAYVPINPYDQIQQLEKELEELKHLGVFIP